MKRLIGIFLLIAGVPLTIYGVFFSVRSYQVASRPNDSGASFSTIGIAVGIVLSGVGIMLLLIAKRLRKQQH